MKALIVSGCVLAIVSWMTIAAPIANADLITPTGIVSSSGIPYANDPTYNASKTIDGNVSTFCVLQDDTLTGSDPNSIPASGSAPTTGHIVFDLGSVLSVDGATLISRADGGALGPKDVAFYLSNASGANLGSIASHTYTAMEYGASENVSWTAVSTRYVGLRVDSSYEQGMGVYGAYYNFQIAEMQFSKAVPEPSSIAMLVAAAMGLLAYAWRKNK